MNRFPFRITRLLTLLAVLSLPAGAADTVATPAPAADPQVEATPLPAPMMGMGMQQRMGDGPGKAPCNMRMGMAEGKSPCKGMGGKCATRDGDLADQVEALEKRLDALQMTLELLTRRPATDSAR